MDTVPAISSTGPITRQYMDTVPAISSTGPITRQYMDTVPAISSTDPIMPGTLYGSRSVPAWSHRYAVT